MKTSHEQYILFRRKTVSANKLRPHEMRGLHPLQRMIIEVHGEMLRQEGPPEEREKEILKFVAAVNTPAEVAALVRKKPLWKYVLFRGTTLQINVGMPVFADGMNLDQLSAEWSPLSEDLESGCEN